MIISFTGTHRAITESQKDVCRRILEGCRPTQLHHGGCVSGDEYAHHITGLINGCKVVVHPPLNTKAVFDWSDADVILPAKNYLRRNHDIVDCCDILIAMPCENKEVLRSGVWATIRYAKKTGKIVFIIYPENGVEAR